MEYWQREVALFESNSGLNDNFLFASITIFLLLVIHFMRMQGLSLVFWTNIIMKILKTTI